MQNKISFLRQGVQHAAQKNLLGGMHPPPQVRARVKEQVRRRIFWVGGAGRANNKKRPRVGNPFKTKKSSDLSNYFFWKRAHFTKENRKKLFTYF